MDADSWISLIVSAAVFLYLLDTLLRPEKF
jgi:K+-transporting ATPase KdpF subunit